MAVQSVTVEELLRLTEAKEYPILDVRSSGEYGHAHIPSAYSLPLFDDEERKEIGTAYKQVSREVAIKIGLDVFGPKMKRMVEDVERLTAKRRAQEQGLLIHCWRGGMRSNAVAWLMDLYGFKVYLLEGGYKAYRQWVIGHWHAEGTYRILDGMTGAGKTEVLKELERKGEPVLDLEGLAAHKGSAFGGLDKVPQPSQEMFENLIATTIDRLCKIAEGRAIWIENESQRVGDLNIPVELFRNWHNGSVPMVFLDLPFEERLERISGEYGKHSIESLINAIVRIKKRLGPLETKTAIAHLVEGDVKGCFRILLKYYDKHYGETKAQDIVNTSGMGSKVIAELLLNKYS
jgi:tRNA 2-selenouridine synthase